MKVHYPKLYNMTHLSLNVFTASKGSNNYILFNKSRRLLPNSFHINGNMIENVKTYTYLGIIFSASGIFSHARKDLDNRGLKAFFKLS